MTVENRIDELINAGWCVVDSDFDPDAFTHWRFKAFECLSAMFGPDDIYTKYFEEFVRESPRANILAAAGVLVAAKEQIKGMGCAVSGPRSVAEPIAPNDGKPIHNGGLAVVRTSNRSLDKWRTQDRLTNEINGRESNVKD